MLYATGRIKLFEEFSKSNIWDKVAIFHHHAQKEDGKNFSWWLPGGGIFKNVMILKN